MHHALISCAIKLLLSETGGEAALYGVQGERTRRAADMTGTAKEITDALQTRPLGYESWYFTKIMSVEKHLISAQAHINLCGLGLASASKTAV
jgi:hypothetical protein